MQADSKNGLEKRVFNIVGLLCAVVGGSTALINYFADNPTRELFISLALFLVGVVFYTASVSFYKDRYLRIPFILILLALTCVGWVTNQGSYGSTPFFIFNLFILCVIILRTPHNVILLVVCNIVIIGLLVLESSNPEAIVPYLSERHRTLDVSYSLMIGLASSATLVYFVVQEYKKERIRNNLLYKQTLKDKAALEQAMADIRFLEGILPVCSFCKKIRDDEDEWNHMETYISQRSGVEFSHGLCPDCGKEHYPDYLA